MPRPPNILFLMTDQQRYDSLGCYGASFAHTPNLDRLAAEGAVFEQCYANNPICTPSRASLMTGRHLADHGVFRLNDNLCEDIPLFTERLQQQGYQTALFGKLHVSAMDTEVSQRHPRDGFEIYEPCLEGCQRMDAPYQAYAQWLREVDPEFHDRLKAEGRELRHPPRNRHMTYWAAERTIDFLRNRRDPARPFFCKMSIFEPHNPYEHYPREMGALVDPDAIPDPVPRGKGPEPRDIERERHENYFGDFDDFTAGALRTMRHGYHSAVAYADLEFGRVLDTLAELGLAEDTLVIFTSDHGDMLGDHDLLVKGAFFFDPNVRVPLIMRWPGGIRGGQRLSGLVQLHDLAATVLAAAGVGEDERMATMPDARNLLDLATGRAARVHDHAICCYRNSGMRRGDIYPEPPVDATMIRDERYKLNVWHENGEGELYDMESDPLERKNLWEVTAMSGVRESMHQQLARWTTAK